MSRRYRYLNGAPLNDTHFDLEVNFLECRETRPGKREQRFSWVTDLKITEANAEALMRAGRARWRIENETFNTLKNQGYGFEHNFGHGKQHLATVFAQLTMLAFLIDQVQQRCCPLFRAAREKEGRSKYLWERLRGLFLEFFIPDWEVLYRAIAFGHHRTELVPFNTTPDQSTAAEAQSGRFFRVTDCLLTTTLPAAAGGAFSSPQSANRRCEQKIR